MAKKLSGNLSGGRMITVENAKKIIETNTPVFEKKQWMPVKDALGRTLAVNISAPLDLPPFDNSAVDGYGIKLNRKEWDVAGESRAGGIYRGKNTSDNAIRIFTGAAVPARVEAVVMQEKVVRNGSKISLEKNYTPAKGENIRKKGAEI